MQEQTPIQQNPQSDDSKKFKAVGKLIWFAIPMVAMLVMGIIIGVHIQGTKIETALKNSSITPCVDEDGRVWLRQNLSYGAENQTIAINYSLG